MIRKDQSVGWIISLVWSWFSAPFPLLWAWNVCLLRAVPWCPCSVCWGYTSLTVIWCPQCMQSGERVQYMDLSVMRFLSCHCWDLQSLFWWCCVTVVMSVPKENLSLKMKKFLRYTSSHAPQKQHKQTSKFRPSWLRHVVVIKLKVFCLCQGKSVILSSPDCDGWTDGQTEVDFLCGLKQDFLQSVQQCSVPSLALWPQAWPEDTVTCRCSFSLC